jgi:type I restriction enzyme S subunit
VLRAREGVDGRYLFYLLWNPTFRRIAEQHMTGTAGQKRLPASFLEGFRAPIVPLPEQRRIIKALDLASDVLRRRREAIALTDALVRSAFLEMFGDPAANPRGWPVLTIGDLCRRGASLVDGPFGSSLKPEHYVPAGIRVVRNWNIRDDSFDASQQKYVTPNKFEAIRRSEVAPDDILITTKGTVGDVCLMPPLEGPSVLSATGTARLRLPKDGPLLAPFVVGQMIVPTYKRYLRSFEAGSAQHYLNLAALRGMRLIVPSITAQERFVAARRRARELKGKAQEAALEAESLWSSLTRRALRGELAVRDRAPSASC